MCQTKLICFFPDYTLPHIYIPIFIDKAMFGMVLLSLAGFMLHSNVLSKDSGCRRNGASLTNRISAVMRMKDVASRIRGKIANRI